MKFKYEVKKLRGEDSNVSILYDIDMQEAKILTAGRYHVAAGKIQTIDVIFDPLPVLVKK